jgi:AcrR family transcriptional regulator
MMRVRPRSRERVPRASIQAAATLNPRGLRSRDRLKQAARDVLNEKGLASLRVQDVTQRAGVAAGLFYRYFHDLREIVGEIARDFFRELLKDAPVAAKCGDPYDWIFENHRVLVRGFAANPGILACLFGLAGDYEEFDQIWKANAHQWNLEVAAYLERNVGMRRDAAERMGFVLGAMTEGVIYQSLIRHTADLLKIGSAPDDIAEVISVMWYRVIFLSNPPAGKIRAAGRRLTGQKSKRAARKVKSR